MLSTKDPSPTRACYMSTEMTHRVAVASAHRARQVYATVLARYQHGREECGLSSVDAMHEALRAARRGELAAMRNAADAEKWLMLHACGSLIADVIDPFQSMLDSPSNVDRILSALRWMASLEAPPAQTNGQPAAMSPRLST